MVMSARVLVLGAAGRLGHKAGDFPHAERAAQEVLSLPMYPELRKEQIAQVVETIAEFLKC